MAISTISSPAALTIPGSVLQVVNATTSSSASTSGTTYIATPITASITPKFSTSKIYMLATYELYVPGNGIKGYTTFFRNGSTNLAGSGPYSMAHVWNGIGGQMQATATIQYLDSPATTSSTTYTVYLASNSAGNIVYVNNDALFATITLMEIAG